MSGFVPEDDRAPLPFSDLSATGILWLINLLVFHPRGLALAIVHDQDGAAIGWKLLGDGSVWNYEGNEDAKFDAVQAFLRQHTAPERIAP